LHLLLLSALRLLLLGALRLLLLIPLRLLRCILPLLSTICAGLRSWSLGRLVLLLPQRRLLRVLFRHVRALLHILRRQG